MTANAMTDRNIKSPSVKANHRLLALSGALGGLIGLALALSVLGRPDKGMAGDAMLTGPLPVWLAVGIALLWGIALPIISWRWEQVVDEHERQAFRDGAVAGFYVLSVGGPVWWILGRAALVPPVDALGLYAAVLAVTGVVWLWRKYR
ncbi:hypothetical protein [Sphingomonas sp. RS2018]